MSDTSTLNLDKLRSQKLTLMRKADKKAADEKRRAEYKAADEKRRAEYKAKKAADEKRRAELKGTKAADENQMPIPIKHTPLKFAHLSSKNGKPITKGKEIHFWLDKDDYNSLEGLKKVSGLSASDIIRTLIRNANKLDIFNV